MSVVRLAFSLDATVSSFNGPSRTAFKTNLARLLQRNISSDDIDLLVLAGSIVVEAVITVDSLAKAQDVALSLSIVNATEIGSALGHHVIAVSTPVASLIWFAAPSPPPPLPPPPSMPPLAPPGPYFTSAVLMLSGSLVIVVMMLLVVCATRRSNGRADKELDSTQPGKRAQTAPSDVAPSEHGKPSKSSNFLLPTPPRLPPPSTIFPHERSFAGQRQDPNAHSPRRGSRIAQMQWLWKESAKEEAEDVSPDQPSRFTDSGAGVLGHSAQRHASPQRGGSIQSEASTNISSGNPVLSSQPPHRVNEGHQQRISWKSGDNDDVLSFGEMHDIDTLPVDEVEAQLVRNASELLAVYSDPTSTNASHATLMINTALEREKSRSTSRRRRSTIVGSSDHGFAERTSCREPMYSNQSPMNRQPAFDGGDATPNSIAHTEAPSGLTSPPPRNLSRALTRGFSQHSFTQGSHDDTGVPRQFV